MIYTFYSYKGGVGRSMALANIGALFFQAGFRVLMVDWDLEAPGLERFFVKEGAAPAPDQRAPIDLMLDRPGLIDLLTDYKERMKKPADLPDGGTPEALFDRLFPDGLRPYLIDLRGTPGGPAWLGLLSAGRRADEHFYSYGQKIRDFSWDDFYARWGGAQFFEWLRGKLAGAADVVLIDSRTGVTEMGGVCVYHLADAVLMMCAPNTQNLENTRRIAADLAGSDLGPYRGDRPLRALVIPSRVEDLTEKDLVLAFAADFDAQTEKLVPAALQPEYPSTWSLRIPYVPYYGFRERVAVFDQTESDGAPAGAAPRGEALTDAYARLMKALAALDGPFPSPAESAATPALADEAPVRVLIHHAPEDGDWCELLACALEAFNEVKPKEAADLHTPDRVLKGMRELLSEFGSSGGGRVFRLVKKLADPNEVTKVLVLLSPNYVRRFKLWDPLEWALELPLPRLIETFNLIEEKLADELRGEKMADAEKEELRRLIEQNRVYPVFVGEDKVPDYLQFRKRYGWRDPEKVLDLIARLVPTLNPGLEQRLKRLGRIRPGAKLPTEDEGDEHDRAPSVRTRGTTTTPRGPAAPSLPPGITDTRDWSDDRIRQKLEEVKLKLDWTNTTGSARKWWEAFENENAHRTALILRLAEELRNRKATITEFFLAYVYSNTDNIQANLHYLESSCRVAAP